MAAERSRIRTQRVAVLALDGCMASAVLGVVDAFGIANLWSRTAAGGALRLEARVVSPGARTARGFGGFPIQASGGLDASDVAIVPPLIEDPEKALGAHPEVVPWLRARHAAGGVVASVCTGAFFLAEAGLLAGRRATTNAAHAQRFLERYPDVRLLPERRLVDEGRVLTSGSTTSFLDLVIHLVDRFAGPELALLTAKTLVVDRNPGSLRPYLPEAPARQHRDAAVLRVQDWLEQGGGRVAMAELARRAGLSTRSLNRRFRAATGVSPVQYLHALCIARARRLLEATDLGIEEITERVGYRDARSFARLFRQQVGDSPRSYRRRFARPRAPGLA